MAKKFSSRAEAGKGSGGKLKKERTKRSEIACQVATGTLCMPVVIIVGEDDDARRDVLRQTACRLMKDGTHTCVLQLDGCSEDEAFAHLAIESTETILEDDTPRAVVCDGLPLDDEQYAHGIARLVEHGAARGMRIVLGVSPKHAGIADAIHDKVSYELDAPEETRIGSPLPSYLYVSEAAKIARASDNYIYDLVRNKEFTDVIRRGRRLLIRTSSFLKFLGLSEDDFH